MNNENQAVDTLKEVQDIKTLMERSSRFISLSGMSGVAAGVFALAGAAVAHFMIFERYYRAYNERGGFSKIAFTELKVQLVLLAAIVFLGALGAAMYFTWKKAGRANQTMWNLASRRLMWNVIIPVVAGGVFILAMLQNNDWRYVAPACLIFYGLGLVNASKYTLSGVRYLGFCQIVLGLLCTQYVGYGLYFWAVGFGVLHIVYGIIMWLKYDRKG